MRLKTVPWLTRRPAAACAAAAPAAAARAGAQQGWGCRQHPACRGAASLAQWRALLWAAQQAQQVSWRQGA